MHTDFSEVSYEDIYDQFISPFPTPCHFQSDRSNSPWHILHFRIRNSEKANCLFVLSRL